jgi:hypothetical protein
MTKSAKNRPEHRIGDLFHSCIGKPSDLINLFSTTYNVKLRRVYRYYSGENKTLSHEMATKFLEFFNTHKHPNANAITLDKLYVKTSNKIQDPINLR